ncbi:MAG: class I SAM-dependent methyltransferase [bacterium]|nr:class I SAM-dependent methyltransferase [bacterium]
MSHAYNPKHYPTHADFSASDRAHGSLSALVALVPERARVLDVGCASGYLGRVLSERGCTVIGLDANEAALEQAGSWYEALYSVDLDATPLDRILDAEQPFDRIIFGDVLEHLRDPVTLLTAARGLLSEGGRLLASLPNVAHGAIRLAMLSGHFEYQRYGLLDEDHLHFFSRETIERTFLRAGYRIERMDRIRVALFENSDLLPSLRRHDFDETVVQSIERDPEHDVLQYVLEARALSQHEHVEALYAAYQDAISERDRYGVECDRLSRAYDETYRALDKRDAEYAALVERFDAFVDEVAATTDERIAAANEALGKRA